MLLWLAELDGAAGVLHCPGEDVDARGMGREADGGVGIACSYQAAIDIVHGEKRAGRVDGGWCTQVDRLRGAVVGDAVGGVAVFPGGRDIAGQFAAQDVPLACGLACVALVTGPTDDGIAVVGLPSRVVPSQSSGFVHNGEMLCGRLEFP